MRSVLLAFIVASHFDVGCDCSGRYSPLTAPTVDWVSPAEGASITELDAASFELTGHCSESGQAVVITGPAVATVTCTEQLWKAVLDLTAVPDGALTFTLTHSNARGVAALPATRTFNKAVRALTLATGTRLVTSYVNVGLSPLAVSPGTPFNERWSFDPSTQASYSFDSSKVEFTAGVCRLTAANQVDSDNTSNGFAAGTLSGAAQYDAANAWLRLGSGASNLELDSSWAPAWSHLKGYWKLNEVSGTTVADSSPSGSTGTLSAGATPGVSGVLGTAVNFDGTTGWVTLVDSPAFDVTTNFTAAAWVNTTTALDMGVIRFCGAYTSGFSFHLEGSTSRIYIETCDGIQHNEARSVVRPLIDGTWHFIAVSVTGTTATYYIDGLNSGSVTVTPPGSGPNARKIGSAGGAKYAGKIDEVSFWDTALSDAAISTIYRHQLSKYAGTFTSRVMDGLSTGSSWTTLSWTPTLPFMKELPDSSGGSPQSEKSVDYSSLVGSLGGVGNDDLMSGIAALFHLNGTGSIADGASIVDASGASNTATVLNQNGTGMAYVAGELESAMFFDGTDDRLDLPATFNPWSGDFSFSVWAYPTSMAAAENLVLATGGYQTDGFRFGIYQGSIWSFWTNESGGTTRLGNNGYPAPPSANAWQHVAVSFQSATHTSRLYFNGVEVASDTGTLNAPVGGGLIGAYGGWKFAGALDEFAIWHRQLAPGEVLQLYRRGANRMKHQVRVCTAADCSDDAAHVNWRGPDGTNQTYFSELNNNSLPSTSSGAVQPGLPIMRFADFTGALGPARYFQYRTTLESDDVGAGCNYGSGATWCSPELKRVTVDPAHYDSSAPPVVALSGVAFSELSTFTQTLGSSCAAGITYTLSIDAGTWYWWDATANTGAGAWVVAAGTSLTSSSASEVAAHISSFASQVGRGTLYVKMYLHSDGTSKCELDELQVSGIRY